MTVPGSNVIIDISHHNNVSSWTRLRRSEIVAIIHKATEGATYRDRTYHERRRRALAEGFLWGSYHFSSGADPIAQVENYMEYAEPGEGELICLDYEPSFSGRNMSYEDVIAFVLEVKRWTGRYPVIYGGALLREATRSRRATVLTDCPLWFSRYNNRPYGIPDPWQIWTLWQYTDGNWGPEPHSVPGIGRCDRNTFNGSLERLKEAWPLSHAVEEAVA
jgi:lysozyme